MKRRTLTKRRAIAPRGRYYPTLPSDRDPMLRELEQLQLLEQPARKTTLQGGLSMHRYRSNDLRAKVLGAVYTPPRVAAALTRWAVRSADDVVLDPSCGEGVFLSAARTRLSDLGARQPHCLGVDIDPTTAGQAGAICADFFTWAQKAEPVDVILGNPPFIRSHLFPEDSRNTAFSGLLKLGLRPSRLMSTWAPFLALSIGLLRPNGRLAMVIPEEILAVGYAEELREFLLRRFRRVIVTIPTANIFPSVQQAVVLLLCDNAPTGTAGLLSMQFANLEEGNYDITQSAVPWAWNKKWSHLFLSHMERSAIDSWHCRMGWQPFNQYGRVEVGIVTGDNDFFLLREADAQRFSSSHLLPIVSSARDLQGIRFGEPEFRRVLASQRPAYLLNLHLATHRLTRFEQQYVSQGERQGVASRYKCRIREPWYAVPGVWESDAILFRQAGDMPRLVHMAKKCAATDTIHRVTWHRPTQGRRLTAGFLNSWTLLIAELTGRSYGGGVLEIMPSEANLLPLPEPNKTLDDIFDEVDQGVRGRDFQSVIGTVNEKVLPTWMPASERDLLSSILHKLVQRRKLKAH